MPIGKTTLPEFGWKGIGDSPLTGITRNPWDTRVTTGGSSAGAAAAAVLNLGVLHLGTDGAGSIRIPAGFCGVYGIKPSFGRVPAYPPSPYAILSHVGPLSRTVHDAALVLTVASAPDRRDMTAVNTPAPDFRIGLDDGVRGLRIAWSPRLGYVEKLHPEVEALTAAAARAFEELGAIVEEADPGFADPVETLNVIWAGGAAALLRAIPESRHAEVDPGLRAMAERGRGLLAGDFAAAANARFPLSTAMARFHERYDLLLTPTLCDPGLRGRLRRASGRQLRGRLDRLDAVQLSVQPDPPAGRDRAVRTDRSRPPGRSADRRPDAPRRPRAARLASLRGDPALADDRGAAGAHRIVRRVTGALYAEYRPRRLRRPGNRHSGGRICF